MFFSEYYHPKNLAKTYEVSTFTMSNKKYKILPQKIHEEAVLPPKYKIQSKRPKKPRYKKFGEILHQSVISTADVVTKITTGDL